jgi:hypothetical protein
MRRTPLTTFPLAALIGGSNERSRNGFAMRIPWTGCPTTRDSSASM